MNIRKITLSFVQIFLVASILVAALGFAPSASAQAACGNTYTVVRGDTLGKIAARCGTTIAGLLRANPSIKNRNLIFPGQVLVLPGALLPGSDGFDVYVVLRGDTLNKIAARFDITVARLLDLNPNIKSANVIYEGQRLVVPGEDAPDPGDGQTYVVKRGDTLRKIAANFDTTVAVLLKLNPQIKDPNRIYVGQRLVVPEAVTTYTVKRGDTLRKIAATFDTTVANLLKLNPGIKDADLIYPGQVIRVA